MLKVKKGICTFQEPLRLPMDMEIILSPDNPVRLVSAPLEDLDYRQLYCAYSSEGRKSVAAPRIIFEILKDLQTSIDRRMLYQMTSYEQYVDGIIEKDSFLAVREKVAAEMEMLKQQVQKIELEIQSASESMLSKESGVHEALTEQSLSSTLKKEWIDVLIDTIYLNQDGSVQIEWSFGDLFNTDAIPKEYEVGS